MTTVLIIGATGFIGKALIKRLSINPSLTLIKANSQTTQEELESMLLLSDFVYHLAAVHRPSDRDEFKKINLGLTEFILAVLKNKKDRTRLLFTSSVHAASTSTSYGVSKKAAEDAITQSSGDNLHANFIRLPHVFGPYGKPNYTSVLHTFCYCISNSKAFSVNNVDVVLDFIYIDDLLDGMEGLLYGEYTIKGLEDLINRSITKLTLQKLLYLILSIRLQVMPNIEGISQQFINNIKKTMKSYN